MKKLLLCLLAGVVLDASDEHPRASQSAESLRAGNLRFVTAKAVRPHQSPLRRKEVAKGQHPTAIILSCSDSRVPPEVVFDKGLGDLFVVRVAGNIVDDAVLGSIEYAAEHLHVPLVVVMGHRGCGAVKAAVDGAEAHDHVKALVEAIKPAVDKAKAEAPCADLMDTAVKDNVRRSMEQLKTSQPTLAKMLAEGHLQVSGAVYDLGSGKVEWLQ